VPRPRRTDGDQPVTNNEELQLITQTMATPGWKLLLLRWEGVKQALIMDLQDDLRQGRPIHAMLRQFALDTATRILDDPKQHRTSLEAIVAHEVDQRAELIQTLQGTPSQAAHGRDSV